MLQSITSVDGLIFIENAPKAYGASCACPKSFLATNILAKGHTLSKTSRKLHDIVAAVVPL